MRDLKDGRIIAEQGDTNLLRLAEPDKAHCELRYYRHKVSHLHVWVYPNPRNRGERAIQVRFLSTSYIECPFSWVDGNLSVGYPDDYIGLYKQLGRDVNTRPAHVFQSGQTLLYKFLVKTELNTSYEIKIVASSDLHYQNI
jgi:hypothetical protein